MKDEDYTKIIVKTHFLATVTLKFIVGNYAFVIEYCDKLPEVGTLVNISELIGIDGLTQIKDYELREEIESSLYVITHYVLTRVENKICYLALCLHHSHDDDILGLGPINLN